MWDENAPGWIDPIEVVRFAQARLEALDEAGIRVTTEHDFLTLYELDIPGKKLSPMFSPRHFSFSPETAFWLRAEKDGRLVQVQAIKVQDTHGAPLSRLWDLEFPRLFPEADHDAGMIAEEGHSMKGRVTYHGDLWLSNELRGQRLGPVFASLGLALAWMKFSPDYLYGFTEDAVTWTGYPYREGFWNHGPLGPGWSRGAGFLLETDWIVWTTRSNFTRLVERDRRRTMSRTRPELLRQTTKGIDNESS